MKAKLIILLLFIQLFILIHNKSITNFEITRSKRHVDQTGKLTPLVVHAKSEDIDTKTKGVDLIFVVDVSGSMGGNRMTLVKESLKYMVKLMNEDDNMALITFHSKASMMNKLTQMTEANKKTIINNINSLYASGGTSIYLGLQLGLQEITHNYANGERVCSIILLSDGEDSKSVVNNFKNYILNQKKNNYIFTLHTLGYGNNHDAELLKNLATIKDGGYFFIEKLNDVNDAFITIYTFLSTVYQVNANLIVQSQFKISSVYGMDEMYNATLTKSNPYTFSVDIIHFQYGKAYSFVTLVDVPENTEYGTEVLRAQVSFLNKTAYFYWDQHYDPEKNEYSCDSYDNSAYEEYMRGISSVVFTNAYKAGQSSGRAIINNGIKWLENNFDGIFDWKTEYNNILNDLSKFSSSGKANILSKIRELKAQTIGTHYINRNNYMGQLIDGSHDQDVSGKNITNITEEKNITTEQNKNYYYFYLKEGISKINGTHFSGVHSTLIIYTEKSEEINIKSLSDYFEYYTWSEKKIRIQTLVDMGRGGNFIIKRDFPFDFYSYVDGKNDILFNIQFLKLEYKEMSEEPQHLFEIKAFIIDSAQVTTLSNKGNNYLPSVTIYSGYYDKGFRVGKILLKRENIVKHLNSNSINNFYIYIVVQKAPGSNVVYTNVEGQFSFIKMNYISNFVPEGFYIFNTLTQGQKASHIYSLKMEPSLGKTLRIEFATSGNELDCKVLKHDNYNTGSEEIYSDYEEFIIQREYHMGKTYIYITQSNDNEKKFENLVISIFSTNPEHIAGNELTNLAYSIRYTTYSNYGLYYYNDINEKNGEIILNQDEVDKSKNIITFYPLKYQNIGVKYNNEKTRFFFRVYKLSKSRQKIYDSISLFENDIPVIFKEVTSNGKDAITFDFQIDIKVNYFITLYTVSSETNEILAYHNTKIYRYPIGIFIDDNNSYENEYNIPLSFDFEVSNNIKKKNLIIQILEFDEGQPDVMQASISDQSYLLDPSNNVISIPNEKCAGQKVHVDINVKYDKKIEYYLLIKLTDNSYEIIPEQINTYTNTNQYILHPNSEFVKAYTLQSGDVLAISSVIGTQQMRIGKLNNEGKTIYANSTLSRGYSPDAQLVQPTNSDFYFLSYHNKQKISGGEAKEKTMTFKDKRIIIEEINRKDSIYQKTSTIALKNGKILVAGIDTISAFGAETKAELNIYNPKTGVSGQGISFKATSKYISCYEQKENNVYCVYISYEDVFVSKLMIKHIFVTGSILLNKGDEVIKTFYIEFNFLKGIPFNEEEALVLFQTGNAKKPPRYDNTGKDLYLLHLEVSNIPGFEVNIKRFEYLYNNCLYNKDNHDPEYYNADIAVLSQNRIYAVCETELNRFKGFVIYPAKKEIDEFNFNNFNAENVKNPVFAKFGKSLGLFYTHINENLNSNIAYQLMNYPDCIDFRDSPILIPKGFAKEFDFVGKIFLSNPYPAYRKEVLKIRFKPYSNITIISSLDNRILVPDTNYHSTFTLKFKPAGLVGIYDIKYTATRLDDLDGLIIGKTCKITFNTPECLEQCESCTEKGTEEHHKCLGCKEGGPYYYEEDPIEPNEGYGKPHFCKRCNISCSSCYGPFLSISIPTTNCKKCDYDNNYFHYEFDERTCISNETKEYWQDVYGVAIYLDNTPGPDKKQEWRWRHCHENCLECFEKGDNIDNKCNKCKKNYYFFCNQTVGNGIPGSCHTGCKNNGFYVKIDEDREKCCPCLDHCKECPNGQKCDKCYPPYFKTENDTLCNESCGYCLAEDRNLWECVNCKTRYKTSKYTLNKTCVDEIPFIESIKRYHHIVDDQCNLLHGCKEGCYKCDPWYTDNCIECNSSYYKEDFYNKTKPKTFHCFNETTCKGITPYKHDEKMRIGGVPIMENGENVCLNCRLRNNSYRLPENKFYCGNKIKRTFVDIEEYNKLSYCYFRCKECEDWGNSLIMNCTICRDSNYYKPVLIGNKYNCYKISKCGIYPYYHDYDLAEKLGKDDDNCGEDCDICLYNFTCPNDFPYFVYETHECVEYCPLTELLGNNCIMNNTRAGILLLENPFGLKHTYDFLNTSVTLNQIISSQLFKYLADSYGIEINSLEQNINNYLGNGQIYNLPESKIIVGNNISIELSSVRLELEQLTKLLKGDESAKKNTSIVDLSSCETILKKKYGLSSEEDLIIIKGDLLQQLSEQFLSNQVEYQIFSTSLGAFLPLNDCKEAGTSVTVTNPFDSSKLLGQFQFKVKNAFDEGYNIFNTSSSFYNDICTPFTNENGNDVLLDERRTDYYNESYNLCEKGCQFIGYNETMSMYTCNCSIKTSINDQSNYEVIPMETPDDFFKKKSEYSNIKVFKCFSQVFSFKGQKLNIGSYILFAIFIVFITSVIIFFSCGKKKMEKMFDNLSEIPVKNIKANPPKPVEIKEKEGYDDFVSKPERNPSNIQKDFEVTEEDLNLADFEEAKKFDKRAFIKYYWSLLKMKQLIIFTFYTYTDHNLRIIKIALFMLFLSFYFAFTALFFNDKIMREIYTYKGNTDAAIHVTNILLSSACCLIMNFIVRLISLSERDIHKIISEKNPEERKALAEKTKRALKIKLIILFIISGLLIAVCWYYVAAFCAVFRNSQIHYFINVLVAFILCNLWPFVTSLIAPCFRIPSLKSENSKCMYKFSQIVSYF